VLPAYRGPLNLDVRFHGLTKAQVSMKLSLLTRFALMTAPLAVLLEIAFLDLGHDPTYFGLLAPTSGASIRYFAIGLASVLVVGALAFRLTRRKV